MITPPPETSHTTPCSSHETSPRLLTAMKHLTFTALLRTPRKPEIEIVLQPGCLIISSWSIHKCLCLQFWRTSFLPQKHLKTVNYGDNDKQWYAAKNFIDLFDDDIDRITLSQMRNALGGPLSMRPQWPQGSQRSICYTVTFSSPWMMLRLRWVSIKKQKPSHSSA